ncbi:amidohydrolase [Desulfobacca acetoxidans]
MPFDHLIHQALLLTMEPRSRPLAHGFVAIQGTEIVAVGQAEDRENLPPARQYWDMNGDLVMPGLINNHCHAAMTLFRGLADDLPLDEWLQQHIFPAEARWVDYEFVYTGTLLAAAELIRGGVTAVADAYFWETAARQAFAESGLRGVAAQGVIDFPAPGVPNPTDNIRVAQEFIDSGSASFPPLITSTLFCHSPYTCSAPTLKQAKDLTRQRGLSFFIHLAETRWEEAQIRRQTGLSPVAYLDSLGILDEMTVAAHAVWVDPADQEILARRGVKICHCPECNLKLASGVAPIPDLLARGLVIGLGTDGAASNNNLNIFGEMNLAAKLHKAIRLDPTVMSAREVVELATSKGAQVLGLGEITGTLTPGKCADLIVVNLHQPHLTPLYDPYSHLVYAAAASDVQHVMVHGRWLMLDRRLLTLDWPTIKRKALALAERVNSTAARFPA